MTRKQALHTLQRKKEKRSFRSRRRHDGISTNDIRISRCTRLSRTSYRYVLSMPQQDRANKTYRPPPPRSHLIDTASDGGYTLLGLPATAGRGTFEGVKWSDALTCKSQTCALASRGVLTRIGGTYHDVDEADDVAGLERRSPRGLAEVRAIMRRGGGCCRS